MDSSDTENDFSSTLPEILEAAQTARLELLTKKSKDNYEREYEIFQTWCRQNKVKTVSENVLLAYFFNCGKILKSSSLWSKYSMLRSTLAIKENFNIQYPKLIAFLKRQAVGYKPKKSATFNRDNINKFLLHAPDEKLLMAKVCLVTGIAGACRSDELIKIKVNDIRKHNALLLFTIPDSKTRKERVFVVNNSSEGPNLLQMYNNI